MGELKTCSRCRKSMPYKFFYKNKSRKDGHANVCKKCEQHYKEISKQSTKQWKKNYYKINKKLILEKGKQHRKKYPWKHTLKYIKSRCNNPKMTNYESYGGRGIKCLITAGELKKLWFRDKAYLMEKPSIDRKENDDNYTYENCEYIEISDNVAKRNKEFALRNKQ